jgi:hypothetical protein
VLFYRIQDRNDNANLIILELKNGHLVLSLYSSTDSSFSIRSTPSKPQLNDNKLQNVFARAVLNCAWTTIRTW